MTLSDSFDDCISRRASQAEVDEKCRNAGLNDEMRNCTYNLIQLVTEAAASFSHTPIDGNETRIAPLRSARQAEFVFMLEDLSNPGTCFRVGGGACCIPRQEGAGGIEVDDAGSNNEARDWKHNLKQLITEATASFSPALIDGDETHIASLSSERQAKFVFTLEDPSDPRRRVHATGNVSYIPTQENAGEIKVDFVTEEGFENLLSFGGGIPPIGPLPGCFLCEPDIELRACP